MCQALDVFVVIKGLGFRLGFPAVLRGDLSVPN